MAHRAVTWWCSSSWACLRIGRTASWLHRIWALCSASSVTCHVRSAQTSCGTAASWAHAPTWHRACVCLADMTVDADDVLDRAWRFATSVDKGDLQAKRDRHEHDVRQVDQDRLLSRFSGEGAPVVGRSAACLSTVTLGAGIGEIQLLLPPAAVFAAANPVCLTQLELCPPCCVARRHGCVGCTHAPVQAVAGDTGRWRW